MDGYETLRPQVLEKSAAVGAHSHDWIGDDQYRNVLGTQNLDLNTYRGFVPRAPATNSTGTTLPGSTDRDKRLEILQNELGIASDGLLGSSRSLSRWVDDWFANDPASLAKGVRISYDPADPAGADWDTNEYKQSLVTLYKKGVFDQTGKLKGYTLRVLDERVQSYPDQTENVDAFLYSNSRIAGLTQAGTSLTVNGGMISGQIGVLAPGRRAVLDTSMDSWQAGAPSGETGTSGLWNENHFAWRSAEGLTNQNVPAPGQPTVAADGRSLSSGALSAFNGNYSRVRFQLWYQEPDTVTPAWTETIDHAAQPAYTIDHPAVPGTPETYRVRINGGTRDVLVGTGYGTEYRKVWDAGYSYNSPTFATQQEAIDWANAQLALPVVARSAPDAPEVTQTRSAWGGSSNQSTVAGTPGSAAWTENIAARAAYTETVVHPEQTTAGRWVRDMDTYTNVESYPGVTGTTEADFRSTIDARLSALGLPQSRISVGFSEPLKYKRYGFQDQLNGSNFLDATTRERDAFLNRWWRGTITLADGRRVNLRDQGNAINAGNGEKFGGAVVNYDYRLRNGGLGFARIGDDVGKRLVWLPVGYVPPPP